jgi:hypothetical protein
VNVRVLGADLLAVHVRHDLAGALSRRTPTAATSHAKPPLHTGDLLGEEEVSQVNL